MGACRSVTGFASMTGVAADSSIPLICRWSAAVRDH
jgi:hypothetical protein